MNTQGWRPRKGGYLAVVTDTLPCIHYWLIEPSNGPKSLGPCDRRGETRSFANSFFETSFGDSVRNRKRKERTTAELTD